MLSGPRPNGEQKSAPVTFAMTSKILTTVAALALVRLASAQNSSALPIVNLGYELHQANNLNVRSFLKSLAIQLANMSSQPVVTITSPTSDMPSHRLETCASALQCRSMAAITVTVRLSTPATLASFVRNHLQVGAARSPISSSPTT